MEGFGMYSDGDLRITRDMLDDLMVRIGPGKYRTFDLIQKYQGFMARNEGKSVNSSWNASFGRILKMYAKDYPARIIEIEAKSRTQVGGSNTSSSRWEVF
jgi:hypothetical protein